MKLGQILYGGLIIIYAVILIYELYQGNYMKAFYWFGAIIITFAMMKM